MSPFEIGAVIYVLIGISVGLWGVITVKKRLGRFPSSPEDIAQLRRSVSSPWDPFGDVGAKRWRFILFGLFGVLVILNFTTS